MHCGDVHSRRCARIRRNNRQVLMCKFSLAWLSRFCCDKVCDFFADSAQNEQKKCADSTFFCTFAPVFIKNSNKKMDDYPADNYNS